jgi:hypothetical protein
MMILLIYEYMKTCTLETVGNYYVLYHVIVIKVLIGHNEDAIPEFLNHWYMVKAHIEDVDRDGPGGKHVEERFAALCYAGMLPGFCLGYNRHGLAYSVNILCPQELAAHGLREQSCDLYPCSFNH